MECRSKHNKAAQKPIKLEPLAQTTSKKKTLKKQIKTEGASQATPAQQVPEWQETEDCKITKQTLACDGSCPIGLGPSVCQDIPAPQKTRATSRGTCRIGTGTRATATKPSSSPW